MSARKAANVRRLTDFMISIRVVGLLGYRPSANWRLDRTLRLPLTRVVDGQCSPTTTTLCSAAGSCLLPLNTTDRSRAVPLLDIDNRAPWRRAPLRRVCQPEE